MNDLILTTPPMLDDTNDADHTLTPLAEFLLGPGGGSSRPPASPREHHNVEDAPNQLSALLQGAGAFDLGSMTQIAITGPDRLRWMNGMVTNSIQALAEGHGNYNFILNAQGRIQGDGYIYRHGEQLLLETSRPQTQKLLDHLDHFIIMDDVELKALTNMTALGLVGPGSRDVLSKLGVEHTVLEPLTLRPVPIAGVDATLIRSYESSTNEVSPPHYELWFEQQHVGAVWQALLGAGATACGSDAVEALRILEGIPRYGVDLRERDLPQETGQARALNFSKGCYLGQEIVERIRSRGNVHRMFTRLELTGSLPIPPTDLRVDGKAAGQITSAATVMTPESSRILALGFLRTESLSGNGRIEYEGGVARPVVDTPTPLAPARQRT